MKSSFSKLFVLTLAALLLCNVASADEGMWLINSIDRALAKNMRAKGLKLKANELYNADADGTTISDAIVSLEFGCTGSVISDKGLVITNHHCAFADVHALSTNEHNYLETGFWAMTSEDEVRIPGKRMFFLKSVLDVTDEVKKVIEEQEAAGKPTGSRKLAFLLEGKYSKETGLEASLSSMWYGSKYYMALYEVYSDVRLVAAPPVSVAAYGGDVDNWEWPQHKCDFAMYRIYTSPDGKPAEYSATNVPLKPKAKLTISTDGYKPGDFTMVIGYPGRTNRYSSSFEAAQMQNVTLPISNKFRGEQMELLTKEMDKDPVVRLKYSDYFFGLSNVQELYSGEVLCMKRFGVIDKKKELEKELSEWINASEERKARWGNLLQDMNRTYSAVEEPVRQVTYYRESLIRGMRAYLFNARISNMRSDIFRDQKVKRTFFGAAPDPSEIICCRDYKFYGRDYKIISKTLMNEFDEVNMDVEKELFDMAVVNYFENVDPASFGPYQKSLLAKYSDKDGRCDFSALADFVWNSSYLTDRDRCYKFINEEHTLNDYTLDPFYRFFDDVKVSDFNKAVADKEGDVTTASLDKQYTLALYQMRMDKGVPQYPDANSTMRITYGTVGDIQPYDAIKYSWRSTTDGLIEKHNPESHDFCLNPRQKELLETEDWGRWGIAKENKKKLSEPAMYVDFLTDNDITGGNSGSPVMNAKGELIGLAFDGNKESLASDVFYTPGYNKCVCVDIRFVLWTLDKYAGMNRILDEIGL